MVRLLASVALVLLGAVAAPARERVVPPQEIALILGLIPDGWHVAQVRAFMSNQGLPEAEAMALAASNWIIADFNRDGRPDLAVVMEKSAEPDRGRRSLQIHLGNGRGGFALFTSNENAMLPADGGGVLGDPLEGVSRNARGSLVVTFYGGSSDRFRLTYIFQFRADDFYLVGVNEFSHNTHTHGFVERDRNLLTGVTILRRAHDDQEGRPIRTSRVVGRPEPLIRMRDFAPRDAETGGVE